MPAGSEPLREWLKGLDEAERQAIGNNLLRAQWRWPVGMPLCRPMGNGLWEVRTDLPAKRTARVLLCLYREHLAALMGFIKKTRATPDEDLETARKLEEQGANVMSKKHMGFSIDDFLKEEGIFEAAQAQAVKKVVAWQLAEAMKKQKISKDKLAKLLKTSRTRSAACNGRLPW
jgi:phage-related protein